VRLLNLQGRNKENSDRLTKYDLDLPQKGPKTTSGIVESIVVTSI
jgi:hypothetical protein